MPKGKGYVGSDFGLQVDLFFGGVFCWKNCWFLKMIEQEYGLHRLKHEHGTPRKKHMQADEKKSLKRDKYYQKQSTQLHRQVIGLPGHFPFERL